MRKLNVLLAVGAVFALFAFMVGSAVADIIVLDSTAELDDAWLWAGGGSSQNKQSLQLENSALGYLKHVFLKFDLSAIPAGSTIDSAVYHASANGAGQNNNDQPIINVYYVTKPWAEGEISWSEYSSGNAWANAGGDAEGLNDPPGSPAVTIDLPAVGVWTWFDITEFKPLIQAWVDGTKPNYGLLMKYASEDPWAAFQWCGSEAHEEGSGYQHVAPTMTINYTPIPEPGAMALVGFWCSRFADSPPQVADVQDKGPAENKVGRTTEGFTVGRK
jgi:hypothetical protein